MQGARGRCTCGGRSGIGPWCFNPWARSLQSDWSTILSADLLSLLDAFEVHNAERCFNAEVPSSQFFLVYEPQPQDS